VSQAEIIGRVARNVGYWSAHALNESRDRRSHGYWAGLYSKGHRDANRTILRELLDGRPRRVRLAAGEQIRESFRWCWTEVLKKGAAA